MIETIDDGPIDGVGTGAGVRDKQSRATGSKKSFECRALAIAP